ncbi:MAG: hypothetical protein CV090_14690 [Nitrospira sp. WS238]|nr:hypothetical protein [Nitrospira sp. WS238]
MKARSSVIPATTVPTTNLFAEGDEALMTDAELIRSATVHTVFLDITRTFDISFVPELFEAMRNRPAYLETAWELFKEEVNLARLDRRTKRIIALAITTNESGTYFIAALPHAFRLGALDQATCDKILSTIRFFKTFERYLSGIMPAFVPDAVRYVNTCLREEYQSYEATRASQIALSREVNQGAASGIGGMIIMIALLSCAAGIYWFI